METQANTLSRTAQRNEPPREQKLVSVSILTLTGAELYPPLHPTQPRIRLTTIMYAIATDVKRCCGCKEVKEVSAFGKNSGKKDGLNQYCRVCHCVRSKKYRQANPEKITAVNNKYRQENIEKITARANKYRQNNPEKVAASSKKYCEANSEKLAARNKKYCEANPEKRAYTCAKYYARNTEKCSAAGAKPTRSRATSLRILCR